MTLNTWIFILAITYTPVSPRYSSYRIYNGDVAKPERYPYVVALIYDFKHGKKLLRRCTGTVLKPKWVLTAAHCVEKDLIYIQYGDMNLKPKEAKTKSRVLETIIHPLHIKLTTNRMDLSKGLSQHDLAMLRTEEIRLKLYGAMSLVDYKKLVGDLVIFAGFGRVKSTEKSGTVNHPLLSGIGRVTKCPNSLPIGYNFVCVNPKRLHVQHALFGDSGGPLLYRDKVLGVLSQGYTFHNVTTTLYVPVGEYKSWIEEVMSPPALRGPLYDVVSWWFGVCSTYLNG